MAKSAELRLAFDRLLPLVKNYWGRPVSDYSAAVYDGNALPKLDVRRDALVKFCSILGRRAMRSGHSETDIQGLVEQVYLRPVIQTGPHCHLVVEPDAFFTHTFNVMGLKACSDRWYINYSVSTVKFTERAKKGPGWLILDGQHVNVFGLSHRRMEPYSICGRHTPQRFALKPANPQTSHPMLDQLKAVLPNGEFSSAADAIKSANEILWPICFGHNLRFLQLDDADVSMLVIDHLRDKNSWLSRNFIDAPGMVARFVEAVRAINSGPWAGWFTFNTDFFWRIHDGRLKRLDLKCGTLGDSSGNFEVSFNSDSLAMSLEAGEIIPSLFLVFMVVAILPGLRAMGGSRQVIYYPLMRGALLAALDRSSVSADKALAASLRSDNTPSVWGHRTIAPTCDDPWRMSPAAGSGRAAALIDTFANMTLADASAGLPGFVNDELWEQCCIRLRSNSLPGLPGS
ncbi:hypothetical protein [Shinella sp. DD12]|uniref:hypothetical protein n=1 Tax=Shinella sp. DD12 TaxID=1410620 RepID=UPI000437BBC6|nr:hypothetical protein [Shinella sp. DD12]EYR77671.1 hypothetical protein SHLA_65c000240 [Shinella sp. DD12]